MSFTDTASFNGFTYYVPTKLVFGKGAFEAVGSEIATRGFKKPLVVIGMSHARRSGLLDVVLASLAKQDLEHVLLEGIRPNPEITKVREGARLIREHACDCILAVGGGSVIDASKGMSTAHVLDDPWDFYIKHLDIPSAVPIFACLTISATGSEMNDGSVVSNDADEIKLSNGSVHCFPVVSFLDPEHQMGLPWYETVNGGVDAMVHCSEQLFSAQDLVAEGVTISLTGGIIRSLMTNLDLVKADPKAYSPRAGMAYGATLALNGTSGAGLHGGCWMTHGLQHNVGALFHHLSHGAGLGVIMPAWIESLYDRGERHEQLKRWAMEMFGTEDVRKATGMWRTKLTEWGHPTTLRQYIGEEHAKDTPEGKAQLVARLTKNFMDKHNIQSVRLTEEITRDVYSRCW